MPQTFAIAADNLLSPMVLFFLLGIASVALRSDLGIPDAITKGLALYLLLAIGFKGGASLAEHGLDAETLSALVAGVVLSASIPWLAFILLRATTCLERIDAVAVAAHYGSISIVTFAAAVQVVTDSGLPFEGSMVAVAAVMESPAIVAALWLYQRKAEGLAPRTGLPGHILTSGSVMILLGSFAVGWATGPKGMADLAPLIVSPFKGVLSLFLLDMGLVAGRGFAQNWRTLRSSLVAFGMYMPIIGTACGAVAGLLVGLTTGGLALLMTLAASASYIAVPAALRVALPEAQLSISLTLSLGITFPLNLLLSIPLYLATAVWLHA